MPNVKLFPTLDGGFSPFRKKSFIVYLTLIVEVFLPISFVM